MGTLIKSSLASVITVAERRQQIKDLISDCPALTFVQSVDNEGNGVNNHFDEWTMSYAGNRRLRFAYTNPSSTSAGSNDGPYIMRMFSGDINSAYIQGVPVFEYPSSALNYLKCYEADRGIIILSNGAIDTISPYGFRLIWGTSEEGGKWCYIFRQYSSSSYNHYLMSNVTDSAVTPSLYFYSSLSGASSSMPPLSLDNTRRHEIMLQCLEPMRWQDGVVLSQNYATPIKMRGFYCFSRATVAPSPFDIYTDQITGKRYLVLDNYSLMEITS